MTSNLTLSRNSATCTSTWTGIQATAVEVVYTTPTWDYDNVTITVPAELAGAVFNSVSLSYTLNGASGTRNIKYSDTRVEVTNANLLERIQNGETEIVLLFSYKAAGGTGKVGSNSSQSRWTNIVVSADCIPSKVYGTAAVGSSSVTYAIEKNSMTTGENSNATFSITPSSACSSLSFELRPTGQTDVLTYTWDVSAPAGVQTLIQPNFVFTGITLAQHTTTADIRITLDTGTGRQQSAWITTQLILVNSRAAPVMKNLVLADIGQNKLPMYVQSKSKIRFTFSVDLDTAADPDVAIVSRSLLIGGESYASVSNQFEVATDLMSGSKSYTITVKDTYGLTATSTGTIDIKPYFSPKLDLLKLTRYEMKDKPSGGQIPVASDEGSQVWVTMTGAVAPCVTGETGNNGWTVTFKSGDTTIGTYTGKTKEGTFSESENTDLINWNFSTTQTHTVAVTIADKFETVAYTVMVSKSGGIFSIEKGGVAVGKRATGTVAKPRFEVAYDAYFEKSIYDKDGVSIAGQTYSASETCIGTFLGKKLYRKVIVKDEVSPSSGSPSSIPTGLTDATVMRIDGVVHTDDYGDLPVNCFHSNDIKAFCRYDSNTKNLIAYASNSNSGAYYIVEYTKESI